MNSTRSEHEKTDAERQAERSLPWVLGQGYRSRETFARMNALEVRLARTRQEVQAAQALRFHVFYGEMSAVADARMQVTGLDEDEFDAICDHMIVIDHEPAHQRRANGTPRIVGTYRLLQKEVADAHGGFYTERKFALDPLFAAHPDLNFLELGRSCILPSYRTKGTLQLLWRGVWTYSLKHDIDVMLGCASFEGTDPDALAEPLSFLHHYARAGCGWKVEPPKDERVAMDRIAMSDLDRRAALAALPPLIKGYLRLGAKFGDAAVIDWQFGTIVVPVVLPVTSISKRYIDHFRPTEETATGPMANS